MIIGSAFELSAKARYQARFSEHPENAQNLPGAARSICHFQWDAVEHVVFIH